MALPSGRYGLAKDWVDKVTGAFKKEKLIPWMKKGEWLYVKCYYDGNIIKMVETNCIRTSVTASGITPFYDKIYNVCGYNILDVKVINPPLQNYKNYNTFSIVRRADNSKCDYVSVSNASTNLNTNEIFTIWFYGIKKKDVEKDILPVTLSDDTVATQSVTSARKVAKAQVVEPTEEETIIDIEQPADEG